MKTLVLILILTVSLAYTQTFPLVISTNGRYFQGSDGLPFLMKAECMWSLLSQCKYDSADVYLLDRQGRGINTVEASLPTKFTTAGSYIDVNGNSPFTSTFFTTPRTAYFTHADSIIDRATALGFVVMLDVLYAGWDNAQGLIDELTAASTSDLKSWGAYIGDRYKSYKNIVFVLNGDRDPTASAAKVDSLVAGIQSADTLTGRLFTTHNNRGVKASTYWNTRSWFNMNNSYSAFSDAYTQALSAYNDTIVRPTIPIEMYFENEHSMTTTNLRTQGYWTILAGACGHVFGNAPLWAMGFNTGSGSNWHAQLTSPGSLSMQYLNAFFTSRNWHKFIPDQISAVLLAGASSGTDLAVCSSTSDSSLLVVYMPSNRQITVKTNYVKSANDLVRCSWFDPATGSITIIGTYSRSSSQAFTPSGSQDWVFLAEAASTRYFPGRR